MKVSRLLEVFDTAYPYKVTTIPYKIEKEDALDYVYEFNTDSDDRVEVHIETTEDNDGMLWEVLFERDGKTYITNTGNAFKIFSTVLRIIGDFIKRQDPDRLFFESDKFEGADKNLSREKLYDRMVRKFSNSMGYSVKTRDSAVTRGYTLEKVKKQ